MQPPSPIHKGRVSTPPSPSPAGKYTSPPTRPPSLVISSAAEKSKEPRLRPTPRIRPPANSRGGIQPRPLPRPPATTRHRQPGHDPLSFRAQPRNLRRDALDRPHAHAATFSKIQGAGFNPALSPARRQIHITAKQATTRLSFRAQPRNLRSPALDRPHAHAATFTKIQGAGFKPALSPVRRQRHVIANQATTPCHFERSREI